MGKRSYAITFIDTSDPAVAVLLERGVTRFNSLAEARAAERAVALLFPGVKVRIASIPFKNVGVRILS